MTKRVGKQTVALKNPPSIGAYSSTVGPKEGLGPLRRYFDNIIEDEMLGEKSWEKAESKMLKMNLDNLLKKANKNFSDIDYIFTGDLLNQCVASNYALRDSKIPFFGLYGACSTMAEAISLGAMVVDGDFAQSVVCMTSSHFCAAEKQYRFPLEFGTQRTPTAQWTVTGTGGVILDKQGIGPYVTHITTGKIIDLGIKDANNMGAAMAPAAADTIINHFRDLGLKDDYYDMVITGDLGKIGSNACEDILGGEGLNIGDRLKDCGKLIFDTEKSDTHAGGSGCGCSASVLTSYILEEMSKCNINKILFVATGALLSPEMLLQGESIPGIAHAISITNNI
ncbi:MAG: stage V sporulation protein AD [Clostridiales bacterium]|nr:stage V sporulation protein AD [Clostridiales bacterium]